MKPLEEIRLELLNQRRDLEQRLGTMVSDETILFQAMAGGDRFDAGVLKDDISSLNFVVKNNSLKHLNEIKRCLKKLDDGNYGICDKCGREIEEDRLNILLTTSLCGSCK